MKKRIKDILESTAFLSAARLAAKFIMVFTNIYIARRLGPELLGLWGMLLLIVYYSHYLDLGAAFGLTRQIPFNSGAGKPEAEQSEMTDSVFTVAFWIGVFFTVVFLSGLPGLYPGFSNIKVYLRFFGLLIIFHIVYNFIQTLLSARKRFFILGFSIIIFAVVQSFFSMFFLSRTQGYGMVAGLAFSIFLAYLAGSVFIHIKSGFVLKLRFSKGFWGSCMKTGLPIMLYNLFLFAFKSIDKILIVRFIDMKALGYYEIASGFREIITYLPLVAGVVLLPNMSEIFGEKGAVSELKGYYEKSMTALSVLVPVFIYFIYLLTPPAVAKLLPAYLPAVNSVRILVVGSFFLSLTYVPAAFMIALNEQVKIIYFQVAAIIANIIIGYILIRKGFGIAGVSGGTFFCYFFFFIIINRYVLARLGAAPAEMLKKTVLLVLPLSFSVFIILLNARIPHGMNEIISGGILFLLLYMPFLYIAARREKWGSYAAKTGPFS